MRGRSTGTMRLWRPRSGVHCAGPCWPGSALAVMRQSWNGGVGFDLKASEWSLPIFRVDRNCSRRGKPHGSTRRGAAMSVAKVGWFWRYGGYNSSWRGPLRSERRFAGDRRPPMSPDPRHCFLSFAWRHHPPRTLSSGEQPMRYPLSAMCDGYPIGRRRERVRMTLLVQN
jgi:hypothetical protein